MNPDKTFTAQYKMKIGFPVHDTNTCCSSNYNSVSQVGLLTLNDLIPTLILRFFISLTSIRGTGLYHFFIPNGELVVAVVWRSVQAVVFETGCGTWS